MIEKIIFPLGAIMQNSSERHVGAICIASATLVVCYAADVSLTYLIALPLLLMLLYSLIFFDFFRAGEMEPPRWSAGSLVSTERWLE